MVATQHPGGTDAGAEMLAAGGNAFDAAVAAAFALGVCEPSASGLAGQTMALLHEARLGRTVALDGSSRAPNHATSRSIPPEARSVGYRAATVPSTPATLAYLHDRYGSLPWPDLLRPAIRLADEGFPVSSLQQHLAESKLDLLRAGTAAELFLADGKDPYREGDTLRQPAMAATLRRLAEHGASDFYQGAIASSIVADMAAHDGLIGRDDLLQVPWPVERDPDRGEFAGLEVATFPPAGAGRVLLQILHVLDRSPLDLRDPDRASGARFLARAIRRALEDHEGEPRDPERHAQLVHDMLAERRLEVLARELAGGVGGDTTHLSVMDADGNAVGLTQSIELFWGACVANRELGMLYNSYISAFRHDDPAHPYALRPNGRPWSSVAPTILYRDRMPVEVVGSPGSSRISSAIAQSLLRIDGGAAPSDAIAAPRLHASPGGELRIEAPRVGRKLLAALRDDGWTVVEEEPYSYFFGAVQLVRRDGEGFLGAADPRRDGTSGGPS